MIGPIQHIAPRMAAPSLPAYQQPAPPVQGPDEGWLGQVPPPNEEPNCGCPPGHRVTQVPEPSPLPNEGDGGLVWDPMNPPLYG